MLGRLKSQVVTAMLIVVCVAGCGAGSEEVIQADPDLIQSDTGAAGGDQEARVDEILSELQTSQSAEGTVITLPENILFDFASAQLKPEAPAQLDRIAEVLRLYNTAPVTIRGYTDSTGSEGANRDLARRRADSVKSYLTEGPAIEAGRLTATGLGEQDPVAPNENPDGSDNPEGREQNRRVEIVVEGVSR
jgi:outer membrane protein OmpA-like peptidoglycan-associated protein